jgi:hypothetical protein
MSAAMAGVHSLCPSPKTVRHPQQRIFPLERSPHPFDDPLYQCGVAFGADLPQMNSRKKTHTAVAIQAVPCCILT